MQTSTRMLVAFAAFLIPGALADITDGIKAKLTGHANVVCKAAHKTKVQTVATMSSAHFGKKKCNTCVLVKAKKGGCNVVVRLTGACATCTGTQIQVPAHVLNKINGPTTGSAQMTAPGTVAIYKKWKCHKPAPIKY
jgi:hypothetical protein